MARDGATTELIAATQAGVIRPLIFVELFFDIGTTRICSDVKTWSWGGNDYLGVGDLGGIDSIEEGSELQSSSISMSLSGIPNTYVSEALGQEYQNRLAKVYKGFLDENYQLIADPVLEFEGEIDEMNLEEGKTATIMLTATNELSKWETPKIRRLTNADQQARFPGDKGLEFVNKIAEKVISWGQI
ncbi:MAG: hypothetical protein NOU37_09305 [Candidatus Brocadiales bacterium]|nr:hypothetical protein [Candidatus Bathyanammoxibius amoris]